MKKSRPLLKKQLKKSILSLFLGTFYQPSGYLQIAAFDVTTETVDEVETEIHTLATTTYWDPTEPTATRPLAFMDHTVATPATYFYTHDLTKNVCEILSRNGTAVSIATTYDYTPFGAVTASNSATPNTFMFSSEVLDSETALVYYNFRHYNPIDGRWTSRDPIGDRISWNLYFCIRNRSITFYDILGYAEYQIGNLPKPYIPWDNGFAYNPNATATWSVRRNYVKYWVLLNRAEALAHLPDGTRAYRHYLDGSGTDLMVNYIKFYNEDSIGKAELDREINEAMQEAERLHPSKINSYDISGKNKLINHCRPISFRICHFSPFC